MAKGQHFLQDPRLALAYYYCCGTDPSSCVFGDEQMRGEGGAATRERVSKLLDDYPKASDIAACQRASESTTIWACASCGRILLENKSEKVYFSSLVDLRSLLMLSDTERLKLFLYTPEAFVRRYRQLLFNGGEIFYLIPELVRDLDKIPLCQKCHADPRKSKFSVATGHDISFY